MRTTGMLAIGTVLTILVAHSFAQSPRPNQGSAIGRYQIVVNPNQPLGTFLLDTSTGTVWIYRTIAEAKGQAEVWMIEDRLDNAQQMDTWMKLHLPTK